MRLDRKEHHYIVSRDGQNWMPLGSMDAAGSNGELEYAGIELRFAFTKSEVANKRALNLKLDELRKELITCVEAQNIHIKHPKKRAKIEADFDNGRKEQFGTIYVYTGDIKGSREARQSAAARLKAAHDAFIAKCNAA